MSKEWKVGDTGWYVPSDEHHQAPLQVVVTKANRKWIECGSYIRFDRESGWVDGGRYISPGKVWPNRDAWEAAKRTARVFWFIHNRVLNSDASEADAREAARLLGISVEETAPDVPRSS